MSLSKKYFVFSVGIVLLLAGITVCTFLNTPRFSVSPGFYNEPFDLEIRFRPGLTCYYTLDGSEPTMDSIPYTGPISLSDASAAPNRYANIRETVTWAFPEVYEQFDIELGDPLFIPDFSVDKCNIVRGAIYDGEVLVANLTGSFFVGFQDKPLYDDISVVSLITDPDNLFDYEKGIYVTGKTFDEYVALGIDTGLDSCWWDANYHLSGHEAERPAYVEVWNEEGTSILSENCGIRLQGNAARYLPYKSLSVYARTEYSGSEVFSDALFGDSIRPHKFVLSSGSNDSVSKLRDYLGHQLFTGLNFATYLLKPCVLFLDGEYWGTYYITEAYNRAYISDHYDVPEQEVIIHKNGTITEGEESDAVLYAEMKSFVSDSDMSLPENYARAQELIDLDSFIDYYAAEIYMGNQDWPDNNYGLWRTRSVHVSSPWRDGRWRALLFDVNHRSSFSPHRSDKDMIAWAIESDSMFASLCKNPDFVTRFIERLRYIASEVCVPDKYEPIFEAYLETMPDLLDANSIRFWGEAVEGIQELLGETADFLAGRGEQIEKMIAQNFPEYS